MLEAQLTIAVISALQAAMDVRGVSAIVQLGNQPRQQGTPTAATIFVQYVGGRPYGWPDKQDIWNTSTLVFDHIEKQWQESRYQVGALAPQTPADPTQKKASDYAGITARGMQSDDTIGALKAQGIGIDRIENYRVLYFSDDKVQNEENPSFDVILRHEDVFITPGKSVTEFKNVFQGI